MEISIESADLRVSLSNCPIDVSAGPPSAWEFPGRAGAAERQAEAENVRLRARLHQVHALDRNECLTKARELSFSP